MNEEWLDTVMELMAEIIAAVYSNDKAKKQQKEQKSKCVELLP